MNREIQGLDPDLYTYDEVVEYKGDIKEDDLFCILNSRPMLRIEVIKVDINPIKEDMRSYMKRSDDYDKHKLGLESRVRRLEQLIQWRLHYGR